MNKFKRNLGYLLVLAMIAVLFLAPAYTVTSFLVLLFLGLCVWAIGSDL